jgi:hypothetical protein
MADETHHNVFDQAGANVDDASSNGLPFRNPDKAPTLMITDGQAREILRLDFKDGKLDATFDPDDLTEAAKIFVNECRKYSGG